SAVEVLADMDGEVLASSAPTTYPKGSRVPVDWRYLQRASGTAKTKQGKVSWAVSPVVTATSKALIADKPGMAIKVPTGGATAKRVGPDPGLRKIAILYVQAPASAGNGGTLADLEPMLTAGAAALGLVVPVGVVFGLLSTRRVIRRLRRLADATVAV